MSTHVTSTQHHAPSSSTGRLSRYRLIVDRPGLKLRAGETVLCADYGDPSEQFLAVVRCESDSYGPAVLLLRSDVMLIEETTETLGPMSWGKPGVRP